MSKNLQDVTERPAATSTSDDENSGLDAVDYASSSDEDNSSPSNKQDPTTTTTTPFHNLPTSPTGTVPRGLVIEMARHRLNHPTPQRGLLFTFANSQGVATPTLFARFHAWIARAHRDEVVFQRGFSSPSADGPTSDVVGGVDFHHWLVDRSRAVRVRHDGSGLPALELRRQGPATWTHGFEVRGRRYTWRRTGKGLEDDGAGPAGKRDRLRRHNFRCEDEEGRLLAFYERAGSGFCCGRKSNRQVGRFRVCGEGLEPAFVEVLLMTLVAVYVKLQKRALQGSQAGIGGGAGVVVMYAVGG